MDVVSRRSTYHRAAFFTSILCLVATFATAQSSDPLYQTKGDHERTYKFAAAGVDSPYRLYVPEAWDGKKKLPLVVILHGSNLNHDAAFDREPEDLKGILKREADKHGFIVVAPEGFKDGGWGNEFPLALIQYLHPGRGATRGAHRPDRPVGEELEPALPLSVGGPPPRAGAAGETMAPPGGPPPAPRTDATAPELNRPSPFGPKLSPEEREKNSKLAEQDVLNVIRIVTAEYNAEPSRLYLMGNSLGMIGTLSLAANHPKLFTAIGPSDGPIDPVFYPYAKLKGLGGAIIVHGEDDSVAPIADSEVIAFLIRQQGIDSEFLPIFKGGHGNSWYMALPKIFDFYDAHPHRKD